MSSRPPAGRRLMVGFEGRDPEAALRRIRRVEAGGLILFARNVVDADQVGELVEAVRAGLDRPLLVALDQEGGAVVRIASGATVFPGNMALGAADSAPLARAQGEISGRQLAALGIDLNLAPVVDLQTNPRNPGIGIRSLGRDRARALPLAEALVRGHAENGVASCLKHFPGKGAASLDAHLALPTLDLPLEALREPHIAIFADLVSRLRTAPLAVMTSHVLVPALDPGRPATISPTVVRGLLRGELGFAGTVLSDCLEMGAVPDPVSWAAAALAAGHDLVPVSHREDRQIAAAEAVAAALAAGRIDPEEHVEAVGRVESLIRSGPRPAPGDPRADDATARSIARAAVHLFGDRRGLLPIGRETTTGLVLPRMRAVVGVEEEAERDWPGLVAGFFRSAGLREPEMLVHDPAEERRPAGLDRVLACERVLVWTWDCRKMPGSRALLDEALRAAGPRLVVAHLRNPFDQEFVPDEITALTAFGYRGVQIEALTDVLAGRLKATAGFP